MTFSHGCQCMHVDFVVADKPPPQEAKTKTKYLKGVSYQLSCILCGQKFSHFAPFWNYERKLVILQKGGKSCLAEYDRVSLCELLQLDSWENPVDRGRAWSLREEINSHFVSKKHCTNWVTKLSHLVAVGGPTPSSGLFNGHALVSSAPLPVPGACIPASGREGAYAPTYECLLRQVGDIQNGVERMIIALINDEIAVDVPLQVVNARQAKPDGG